ncbi:MAG: twin-arginine translocation signal domain-containing protein, partial [Anaerolineae bacterium]|nr:twin-arginine translocation signal domain-containing protein [Anaerolineae bacterium]
MISRRGFLKGIGAGIAAGLVGSNLLPTMAQVSGPDGQLFGIYRF